MDNRITRKRLSDMLAYDWIKIIASIVAVIVLWELVYSVGRVSLTVGQSFKVYYFHTISSAGNERTYTLVEQDDVFSYDVIEFGIENLDTQYWGTILQARSSVCEGDVMIVDNTLIPDGNHPDDPAYSSSNFKTLADGGYRFYDFDRLLLDAENYLSNFLRDGRSVQDALDNPGLFDNYFDSAKIKQRFDERMSRDNRFRKDEQKAAGFILETERIKKLCADVSDFRCLLSVYGDSGLFVNYRKFEHTYLTSDDKEPYEEAYLKSEVKKYGLNLYFLEQNLGAENVANLFQTIGLDSSKDAVLMVFDYLKEQPDLQFETISFINAVVGQCSTLFDGR